MNRHQGPFSLPTLSGILILVVTASAASIASAQATQSTGALGEAIKSSTDFNAITAAVDQFVTGQVQALAGADPVARSAARDALIDAAVPRGGGNASPTFLDVYARGLNDKIVPILGNENELIRLNAAIVVAKVAEKADNINLRDAVLALLKDKSPTVSLWALKAAKTVIIPVIRNPAFKGDQLLSGVVAATKAHGAGPLGGPVALDGYDALALDQSGAQPARRPNNNMLTTVVPFVQQLLQERVTAYRNGIPPEPLAERVPVTFLTHVNVWKIQTPEQKLATIQGVSDLVSLAAEHMAKAEGLNREKLALVLGNAGQALQVVPELADIRAKIEPLGKVNQNTPPNDVAAAAGAVYDALKGHKLFAKLNVPPRVTAAAAGAGGDKEIVETTQPSGTTRPATTRAAAAPATQPKAPAPAAAPAGAAPKSPAPAAPAGGAKAPAAAPNAPAAPAPAPR